MQSNNNNAILNHNSSKYNKSFDSHAGSVLDNIGTFRHFCDKTTSNHHHKKDFYTLYYRRKNLLLKHKLENSKKASEPIIQKVCKNLACCSSLSEVTQFDDSGVHITATSKKCKNRYCLICSRIESNKNTLKFIDKTTDPDHIDFFKARHFYMLTLTVRHNDEVRNDNYLKEFRNYVNKFQRSLIYKNTFIQSTDKMNYGGVQSIEMTISKGQYHIHSHSLLCALPIKRKINEVESDLRAAWSKITGDSDQIKLDLVRNLEIKSNGEINEDEPNNLIKAVSEVFKYVVKCSSLSTLQSDQIEMLADWMIETKGKNFINALGYFRKLGIVRRVKKSETSEAAPIDQNKESINLTKTISINSNANLNFNYSKQARNQVLKYFKITSITDLFADVTDIETEVKDLFKEFKNDEILDTFMISELEKIKKNNHNWDQMQNTDFFSDHFQKEAAQRINNVPLQECPF
jgi:hypothetical protein